MHAATCTAPVGLAVVQVEQVAGVVEQQQPHAAAAAGAGTAVVVLSAAEQRMVDEFLAQVREGDGPRNHATATTQPQPRNHATAATPAATQVPQHPSATTAAGPAALVQPDTQVCGPSVKAVGGLQVRVKAFTALRCACPTPCALAGAGRLGQPGGWAPRRRRRHVAGVICATCAPWRCCSPTRTRAGRPSEPPSVADLWLTPALYLTSARRASTCRGRPARRAAASASARRARSPPRSRRRRRRSSSSSGTLLLAPTPLGRGRRQRHLQPQGPGALPPRPRRQRGSRAAAPSQPPSPARCGT